MELPGTASTADGLEGGAMSISPKAEAWFEARAINREIVARMGIYSARREQAGGDGAAVVADPNGDVLAFPYLEKGIEVAAKYRGKPRPDGSKVLWQKPKARKTFYNSDVLDDLVLRDGSEALVIVEGELDCLAVMTAGHPFVVSVPDGAPPARDKDGNPLPPVPDGADDIDPDRDAKYSYISNNWHRLKDIKRIVLMVDADEPGERLRAELARRIGRIRCLQVKYPPGCKDANEVLQQNGAPEVLRMIAEAQAYPVRGIYRLRDFPDMGGPPKVYSTGWGRLDPPASRGMCSLMLELGAFMVVLGLPESGKSTWVIQLAAQVAAIHGWNVAFASFEMKPVPYVRDLLFASRLRMPRQQWNTAALHEADAWVNHQFRFICNDADEEPTLEWLIDRASDAVVRDGINMLIVDPWNELEHKRKHGETMTEYTNRAIRALKAFARLHDVLVAVVVHPTKDGGLNRNPAEMSLYDAEGSSHWVNKPDIGIIVERNYETGQTFVHGKKFRHRVYGSHGQTGFQFIPELGLFSE
jgi:twinkle protein